MSDDSEKSTGGAVAMLDQVAPSGWKVKVAKLFVQMGLLSETGVAAYSKMRSEMDTIEGRSIIAKAQAQAVALDSIADPEQRKAFAERFLGDQLTKQRNVDATVVKALSHVAALPPPSEQPTINNPDVDAQSPGPSVGEDWAASWKRYAEDATSDQLRDRLAKVLAGELQRPGRYPTAVVRALVELDQGDIERLKALTPFRLGRRIFTEKLPEEGRFEFLLALEEAGLLTGNNGTTTMSFSTLPEQRLTSGLPGERFALVVTTEEPINLSVPVAILTKAGLAAADLLSEDDEIAALKLVAQYFPEAKSRTIVAITQKNADGTFQGELVEIL